MSFRYCKKVKLRVKKYKSLYLYFFTRNFTLCIYNMNGILHSVAGRYGILKHLKGTPLTYQGLLHANSSILRNFMQQKL